MFELDVENSFSAGHALRGYRGKCENPHGHNYKVRLTLAGEELNHIGLLCDFKEIKSWMNEVVDRLDHQNLNELEPFRTTNPSAENMAHYIYQAVDAIVAKTTAGRARVKRVKLWETDLNAVTYFE